MKKIFFLIITIILCFTMLVSCANNSQSSPTGSNIDAENGTPDLTDAIVDITNAHGEDVDNTSNEQDPCIQRYLFYSLEDFKMFCITGSRNVSLYKQPPQNNLFPRYNMVDGCFLELSQLFPMLNLKNIAYTYVEVARKNMYSISGKTKDTGIRFNVRVEYLKGYDYISPEDRILDKYKDYSSDYEIIYGDINTDRFPEKRFVYYITKVDNYIVMYDIHKGDITGVNIWAGDFIIGIGYMHSQRDAFFKDQTLKPITGLYSTGNERINAIRQMGKAVKKK